MNIALLLARAARAHPDAPALAHGTRVIANYATLHQRAARLAGGLRGLGLQPGDRIALVMRNHPAYLELFLAAWHAGLVAVPVNSKLHAKELAYIFENCGAPVVFASANTVTACEEGAAMAQAITGSARRVIAVESSAFVQLGTQAPLAMQARHHDDLAWLFYTSGTTGRPKGVVLSCRNLRWATLAYTATVQSVAPGDVFLHPAPLSHGSGLYHLPYVMNGGVNVVPRSASLNEAEFFALAAHWRNASSFAAPTIVNRLAAHAAAHELPRAADGGPLGLATLVYGGAPMYLADLERAHAALGPHLAQIYGQGESPMTITVLPRAVVADRAHPQWRERMASVGFAQPMVEVSVRDGKHQALPAGQPGEVCVKGEVVMASYWQDPAASAAALHDGWLHTGDIGRLDEQGFLTLLDRSKDLVISGGNNIYPREVEEALLTHAGVAEVAVLGRPDPTWGEVLVAYVVARAGAAPDAVALDAHCLTVIARYKRPKAYRWVASLPKNHYGKVEKNRLREMEANASTATATAATVTTTPPARP